MNTYNVRLTSDILAATLLVSLSMVYMKFCRVWEGREQTIPHNVYHEDFQTEKELSWNIVAHNRPLVVNINRK